MPTTYTVDQEISTTSSKASTTITMDKSTIKVVSPQELADKDALNETMSQPIIFSSRTDGTPVVFWSKTDGNPIIFFARFSLKTFYRPMRIFVINLIQQTINYNLYTFWLIAKNVTQTITTLVESSVTAIITISQTATGSADMASEYDEDANSTEKSPTTSKASAIITMDKTKSQSTSNLGTDYSTVVA